MALMDSIAARKAKIEEVKRTVQDQRAKRDEYAAFVSRLSIGIFFSCVGGFNILIFVFVCTMLIYSTCFGRI